jgi:hypothetical protein
VFFSLEIALFGVGPSFSQIFDHPNASKHPHECMTAVSAELTNLGGGRRARPLQRVGGPRPSEKFCKHHVTGQDKN